jgi:hypothetical protein
MPEMTRFRLRKCLLGVTMTTKFIKGSISLRKSQNSLLVWLGVGKCKNVFGHIFTKDQLTKIKYISNYAACDREGHHEPKIWEYCWGDSKPQKVFTVGKSWPKKPKPSLGEELSHKHLKNRKLCYSATTTFIESNLPAE